MNTWLKSASVSSCRHHAWREAPSGQIGRTGDQRRCSAGAGAVERGSFVVFGAVVAIQAGNAKGRVQGCWLRLSRGIASRFVAVAQVALGDVVAADAIGDVAMVTSMWTPPGCVPSARCTSKKPTTSSSTSLKYLVL